MILFTLEKGEERVVTTSAMPHFSDHKDTVCEINLDLVAGTGVLRIELELDEATIQHLQLLHLNNNNNNNNSNSNNNNNERFNNNYYYFYNNKKSFRNFMF